MKAWNASKGQTVTLDDHLNHYADIYRGYSTFVKMDPKTGRMIVKESFQIELPPYTQDLADAGKGVSDGYAFINSFNVEMATGGIEQGKPPIEVGASQLDFDYLHIIDWKKAEAGRRRGQVHRAERHPRHQPRDRGGGGLLHLAPEPRSPHGVDVAPKGDYISVAGKLDPHVTVYGFELIKKAIEAKNYEGKDRYGVPILKFDAVVAGKVELGAGPLHTQYDNQGNALHQPVSRERGGEMDARAAVPPRRQGLQARRQGLGPLQHRPPRDGAGRHGGSAGQVPVAMNKWSIDRHTNVGPLHPQNFQLIDISGAKMELLADMPIGFGEPHYAQMVKADMIKAHEVYAPGVSPATNLKSPTRSPARRRRALCAGRASSRSR